MTSTDLPRSAPTAAQADPRRWWALAVIAIAQLMIVLDASIVTIALPSAQRALHISIANRQWVLTAYTLAFGGLLLLGGRVADFMGRKRMFIVGLLGLRRRLRPRRSWPRAPPCSSAPAPCREPSPPSWRRPPSPSSP